MTSSKPLSPRLFAVASALLDKVQRQSNADPFHWPDLVILGELTDDPDISPLATSSEITQCLDFLIASIRVKLVRFPAHVIAQWPRLRYTFAVVPTDFEEAGRNG